MQGYTIFLIFDLKHMSRIKRKPEFYLCKNKGTDQLCSNCTADQHVCFRYKNNTMPLLLRLVFSHGGPYIVYSTRWFYHVPTINVTGKKIKNIINFPFKFSIFTVNYLAWTCFWNGYLSLVTPSKLSPFTSNSWSPLCKPPMKKKILCQ